MRYFLSVNKNKLELSQNEKLLEDKSIKDSDCDLWILKMIQKYDINRMSLSSSIHWDFVNQNNSPYNYAVDIDNNQLSEIIINTTKIEKYKEFHIRRTGKEDYALIFHYDKKMCPSGYVLLKIDKISNL